MLKTRTFLIFFLLIFAVAFLLPPVLFIPEIIEHTNNLKLSKSGVEAVATIIPNSQTSNLTINGVPYYKIEYTFINSNGEELLGKTSQNYTYYQILNMTTKKTILIKYDPETNKSIEKNYHLIDNTSVKFNILFVLFFGIADLVFWIFIILSIIKLLNAKRVEKNGQEYTATFLTYKPGITINHVPHYKFTYSWQDDNGITHHAKSLNSYTYNELKAFESAGQFQIKAIGNTSTIISDLSTLMLNHVNQEKLDNSTTITCSYCGAKYEKNNLRCPSCGGLNQK